MKDNIEKYENILISNRGWVSRWPKKAVFIFSGGMDSTVTIARLLSEMKIEIFPAFINRGQTNLKYERKSVKYFDNLFKIKYSNLYHEYVELKIDIPPTELKNAILP